MGDLLAIVSKAQFEADHRAAKVGDALGFEKYVSTHAALTPLEDGGSLFLVTVRPPDERLWLVAELVKPKHDGKAWKSTKSKLTVRDITALIPQLKFANGKGLAPKKGALGMSLQTPRLLSDADVALLRGGESKRAPEPKPATEAKPTRVAEPTPEPRRTSPSDLTLTSVLAEWRTTRAPELEALLETLSAHHARAFPPLDPEADDYDAQWNARMADATPEALPHLLPGLWSDPRGSIPMRLRKLLELGADPRLGEALLKMIDDPPLTASSNFSVWTLAFKALPSMVDTRAAKRLQARAKKKGGTSQFWPKLVGWIETALEQLPEPATLTKDQRATVAKRQKQADALLKGAPPSGPTAKKERAAKPLPLGGSPREALAQAVASLEADQPFAALEPLRQYWVATREGSAAELLAKLGKTLASTQPRFDEGKPAAVHAAWMRTSKQYDARLVTPLLDALTKGPLTDTEERLEAMLAWAPDPRVAEAMMRLIFELYIGARPQLWKRAYELLVLNADPRFQAKLEANATRLEGAADFDRNRAERPHATRTIAPYVEACARARKPSPDEQALLTQLATLVGGRESRKKSAQRPDEELALLRAIVAAPDDPTPRLVYADFLTERGDPRGEYVNLALALARGEKVKSKLEALEKKLKKEREGALAGMIWNQSVREGFLHTAHLGFGRQDQWTPARLAELVEDLRWVTIRHIHGSNQPHVLEVLTRAPLYGLEELEQVTGEAVTRMAARDFPWALRTLRLYGHALPDVPATAFPKLTELTLFLDAPLAADGLRSPLASAVETLTLKGPGLDVAQALERVFSSSRIRQLTLDGNFLALVATRADAGLPELALEVRYPPQPNEAADSFFESLARVPAGAVRRVTVTFGVSVNPPSRARVEAALAHLPRA